MLTPQKRLLLGLLALFLVFTFPSRALAYFAPTEMQAYQSGASVCISPGWPGIATTTSQWYQQATATSTGYTTGETFATGTNAAGTQAGYSGSSAGGFNYPQSGVCFTADPTSGGTAFDADVFYYFGKGDSLGATADSRQVWFFFRYHYFHSGATTTVTVPTVGAPTPRIYSVTAATSTRTVTVTGYAFATTSTSTYAVSVKQLTSTYGLTNLEYKGVYTSESAALDHLVYATTTGLFSYDFTFENFATGVGATTTQSLASSMTITARLSLYNLSLYDPFGPYNPDYVSLVDAKSIHIDFDSAAGIYYGAEDAAALAAYPEYECSFSSLTGCLKNAALWLFYPTPASTAQFKTIQLKDRAPFSYAYDIGTIRNELFTATPSATSTITASTTIGSITLLSAAQLSAVPYASTIKTVLGWLMWFFAAELIWFQVRNIFHKPV